MGGRIGNINEGGFIGDRGSRDRIFMDGRVPVYIGSGLGYGLGVTGGFSVSGIKSGFMNYH